MPDGIRHSLTSSGYEKERLLVHSLSPYCCIIPCTRGWCFVVLYLKKVCSQKSHASRTSLANEEEWQKAMQEDSTYIAKSMISMRN